MITLIDLNKTKQERLVFDKPGKYIVFFYNLSGKFEFEISSEGVEVNIFGLLRGKRSDNFQVETIQHHKVLGSTSNLLVKGVFDDESKLHYKGLIRIEKDAQLTHAYQKNQNVVLSPKVFIESEPYLEILANDVFCTHGSTTGKLNNEEIYYLQTRGMKEKQAKMILAEGFVAEVFDKIREHIPDFNYNL